MGDSAIKLRREPLQSLESSPRRGVHWLQADLRTPRGYAGCGSATKLARLQVQLRACVANIGKQYSDYPNDNHVNEGPPELLHALRCKPDQSGFRVTEHPAVHLWVVTCLNVPGHRIPSGHPAPLLADQYRLNSQIVGMSSFEPIRKIFCCPITLTIKLFSAETLFPNSSVV